MRDRRGSPGFAHEAQTALLVGELVGGEHLQRDGALELLVLGPADDTHPALADPVEDAEVGEAFAGLERHRPGTPSPT